MKKKTFLFIICSLVLSTIVQSQSITKNIEPQFNSKVVITKTEFEAPNSKNIILTKISNAINSEKKPWSTSAERQAAQKTQVDFENKLEKEKIELQIQSTKLVTEYMIPCNKLKDIKAKRELVKRQSYRLDSLKKAFVKRLNSSDLVQGVYISILGWNEDASEEAHENAARKYLSNMAAKELKGVFLKSTTQVLNGEMNSDSIFSQVAGSIRLERPKFITINNYKILYSTVICGTTTVNEASYTTPSTKSNIVGSPFFRTIQN